VREVDDIVNKTIDNWSVSKRRYEEKKSKKNGFDSLESYIEKKLHDQNKLKILEHNKIKFKEIEKELKLKYVKSK